LIVDVYCKLLIASLNALSVRKIVSRTTRHDWLILIWPGFESRRARQFPSLALGTSKRYRNTQRREGEEEGK
jgi:hypothetical protein